MRLATWVAFIAVLLTDLVHKIWTGSGGSGGVFLDTPELVLLVLVLFVGAGDRIAELAVGKGWIKIRQSIDKQAKEAAKDIQTLASIAKDATKDSIDELLTRATGQEKDIWSRLVVYRLTMRLLLRRICAVYGMPLRDTTAFVQMIEFLQSKNALSADLRRDIEAIRDVTFFFEWGTGSPPDASQIKATLKRAPRVIRALEVRAGELAQSGLPG